MSCESSGTIHDIKRAISMCKWAAPSPAPILRAVKGQTTIELAKKEGSPLGLTISGGIDKDGKPRVAQLKPGSLAQKSDVLETGDIITGINSAKTAGLRHEQIIDLIKQAGDQLTLEIEYDLPKWPLHASNTVQTKTIQIQLEKENQSYGFILRGGNSDDKTRTRPLIITKIRPQGPADKEGTLKIGDRVLAINGINVSGATLEDANNIMRQCRGTTLFLIEYDVAIVDSVKHATGPLLIEIEKSLGSTIGINLTQKWIRNNRSVIVIDNVKPASIADRCGALHSGDQINAVDQKPFDGISLMEANAIVRACTGDFCHIEVTPASALAAQHMIVETTQNRGTINNNDSNHQSYYRPAVQINSSTMKNNHQNIPRKLNNKTRHNSISSLNSCYQTLLNNQMCHTETMECTLQLDSTSTNRSSVDDETIGSFGFTIQNGSFTTDILLQPPIIGYLAPGGIAERSGTLQLGDRILSINGQPLEGMLLEDARSLIKGTKQQLHLDIEFDVADSVMLSSGICQVKILRKNLDLGLSVTYSRTEDVPIISDVKRGSIAYRCGMIQAGDHLLSIDTHSLRGKNLNDIHSLLKTSDDIVRLRIKKDDIYSEDNLCENVVVYKVQLLRQGGPLGLTISGSEDVFQPIVVSDLCEGGLADRTNAIHIGDRILAINDVSLRGKGLNQAIKLLQTSGDEITLKISRLLHQPQKDYTPSVDSAIDSWSSSYTDNRLSENGETTTTTTTKDIVINEHQHQHYQVPNPNTSLGDFVLKHRTHLLAAAANSNRSVGIAPPASSYRTPPTNARIRESQRHPENERPTSCGINDKTNRASIYDAKYDNYARLRSTNDTLTLILKRDKRILDFGFSISDRLYGTGVYVNKIRPNGPAELEGTLIPCMRIYKVNNIDVTRMECNQVVPLLSSSPDDLTLVVGRRPAPMFDETDEFYEMDENEDEHRSSMIADGSINDNRNSTIDNNNNNNTYAIISQSKTSII
ncbi:unnamed protein product [Adineta steineri]|uniref:PDZ domain-containing protein n=1 Tax=Adineta steineri TaxID=433720 RepID=A0A818VQH7_9BILA|nr:unnamed protein product [Adineta steineri]CAF3714554.1 unnamed protein product [Adineta steineri]